MSQRDPVAGLVVRRPRGPAYRWVAIALVGAAVSVLVVRIAANGPAAPANAGGGCGVGVRVVAPSSFLPVLTQVGRALASGPGCLRVDVGVLDGRTAAERIGDVDADVWIADDSAWAGVANPAAIAAPGEAAAGTVLATSPIYLVTDRATADRIARGGGSWLALERLLTTGSGVRLAVSDPAGSGDGLLGVGAVGESVWLTRGMDASARALSQVFTRTRTVSGVLPVRPQRPGEVALVSEHALLSNRGIAGKGDAVLTPTDHTAMLRYTWLPTAAAAVDPDRRAVLATLLAALTGPRGLTALTGAGLRPPAATGPAGREVLSAQRVAAKAAPPLPTMAVHKVFHVFAVWYPADRRTKLLIGVDVSGSMGRPAAGTGTPLISVVQQGCLELGALLPPDASLALWEFGSQLDPPRDYRTLLAASPVSAVRGAGWRQAVSRLTPLATGTGLFDTVLAAYQQATASYRAGEPNRVMIFTDGQNGDDPGSISLAQLAGRLSAAADPDRPVELVVVVFGRQQQVAALQQAIRPVGGAVDRVGSAEDVLSTFVHLAAGGLHG
jgi:hypothetical protein